MPVFGDVAIYVAQRAHIRLDGRVDPDGGVRGGVTFLAMEQRTLAASHSLFASTPEMTTDPSRSGFVLRPCPPTPTVAACGSALPAGSRLRPLRPSAAAVAQDPTLEGAVQHGVHVGLVLLVGKAQGHHALAEAGVVATTRVHQDHRAARLTVCDNKGAD